jgi:hypothetical protein
MANPSSSPARARRPERENNTSATDSPTSQSQATLTSDTSSPSGGGQSSRQTSSAASSRGSDSTSGGGVAQKIREQANARLSSQKDRALDGVGGVTQAIRKTTQSLRDQQHDTIARYVEDVIGQVDRVTQNLRQKDVGELIGDAQRLARRQPAVFVGGAFALGLLAARLLKSSPPNRHRAGTHYGEYRYRGQTRGQTPAWQAEE